MVIERAHKVVLCGAGFLGSRIAKALTADIASATYRTPRLVQISSRAPDKLHAELSKRVPTSRLLPPVRADVTKPDTLDVAFEEATAVVSLVGILQGSPKMFEDIQWHGAENVAKAAKKAGAKLVHISAIGADRNSNIPYARTKALGEEAVREVFKDATIIRPSIVFGPGDGFFARFASLSRFLPFLPVFGGGHSRFQPVYVGDIARFVECSTRVLDKEAMEAINGKTIEAGGPDVFTYKEIMELVLKHTGRRRPILSLPYSVGKLQGLVLEQLPPNLFTLTRDQVEQLKNDNIIDQTEPSFTKLFEKFTGEPLKSVHEILPQYL